MRKIFSKIFILLIFSLALTLSFSLTALAADVTLGNTTNIYLASSGTTLTIVGEVSDLTINDSLNYITITSCAACAVTVTSDDSYILTTNLPNVNLQCESSRSYLTFTTGSSQAVTVTPSTETCTPQVGGGGGGGGGGTSVTTPTNTSVVINDDAETTSSRNVTLTLSADNATLMMVSNDPNFADVSVWQDYAESLSWTLNAGGGDKTVYAKFRSSSGGESSTVSDTVVYSVAAEEEVEAEEEEEVAEVTPAVEGDLVKAPGKSSVYILANGVLRPITSGKVFEANGYDWDDITEMDLSAYQTGDDVGYPENYSFTDGMLVKGGAANVYVISNGLRRWIQAEEIFLALGYQFYNVHNISDQKLGTYTEGEYVISSDTHPDGSLLKYHNDNKVYRIANGLKRWVTSESAFNNAGYDWSLIIDIEETEIYDNGVDIN